MRTADPSDATRFPFAVDTALREAGWQPGRWNIAQVEIWADTLLAHTSPTGHRHTILPTAVEVWAEFGNLHIAPPDPGLDIASTPLLVDPLRGLHLARTLSDLGQALDTHMCPLGIETSGLDASLAIDAEGRVYSLDHTGDWYLGASFDEALGTLVHGTRPVRLTVAPR